MRRAMFGIIAAAMMLSLCPGAQAASGCAFQANGMSLSFGILNPSVATNMTATATASTLNADRWGSCSNTTMSMTADNGQNFAPCGGSRCMRNGVAFIRYSLTLPNSISTGPGNTFFVFTLTGQVMGSAYIDAPAGNYTDRVVLTVNP
jgi:hypothetical protein